MAGVEAAVLFAAGAVPTAVRLAGRKPGIRSAPQYPVADRLQRRRLSSGIGDYRDTQPNAAAERGGSSPSSG